MERRSCYRPEVSSSLSLRGPGFRPRSLRERFAADRATLTRVQPLVLAVFPVDIIPLFVHTYSSCGGWTNGPLGAQLH